MLKAQREGPEDDVQEDAFEVMFKEMPGHQEISEESKPTDVPKEDLEKGLGETAAAALAAQKSQ